MKLLKDSTKRMTSVEWPTEVDARLDVLRRLAAAEGVQISRAQLLAALVVETALQGPVLAEVATRYLAHRVEDFAAEPDSLPELPVVSVPGRRRRSESA
jgi:hypothetical protein